MALQFGLPTYLIVDGTAFRATRKIKIDGDDFLIMREDDVLGIVQ